MKTPLTGLILIVDDTPTNLDVISEALSDAGFDVAIATSGERALQQLERRTADLILLDVMMPGMNGFETCQHLKKNTKTCDIPVIFMTALSDADSKVQALEIGAVDYITKPFQEKEVLARVKTHLQLRRLTQSLENQVTEKTVELQASQIQIIQNEKMSALGQLIAGVAHEINNPVGFISGNLSHAEEYIKDMLHLLGLYQQHYSQPVTEIQEKLDEIDLDYLREDLPKLIESMQTGIHRILDISISLRNFSRTDNDRPVLFNIHEGINSTILILKHRLQSNDTRPAIAIIKEYGDLPQIECYPGQLNQVFMNLLANAIDALDELNQSQNTPNIKTNLNQILIKTEFKNQHKCAIIRIEDTGIGMTDEVKNRIFKHSFTTKEVGKGTGLGLAIAHSIVVDKHFGTLEVNSNIGQGTEFVITIPIQATTI
ncbi:hybrid sensor histidine kinase/response regulator [Plectonema radiosum NIES-515]|uniref:histidine kinase n=1 Tax=Plectonema radiosum NIES-515 TaxID=2986073 RepID=A0ABT3B7R1_9CYAN|nr:hybrid sensor histidine kinase/response regulator [Plectonema radiosum]MCV3217424.1 hybrid sensor histidine kinase/response regulator [Plectonema radiosum NIES-515]